MSNHKTQGRDINRGLIALSTAAIVLSCSGTLFNGTAPTRPTPKSPPETGNPSTPPTDPGPGVIKDPEVQKLSLTIKELNSSSWWKNCLTVSIGQQVRKIGCNKGALSVGEEISFLVPKAPACTKMIATMETFKNTGIECEENAKLGKPCVGPYPALPSMTRNSKNTSGAFRVFNANNIGTASKVVKKEYDLQQTSTQFKSFVSGGNNSWVRFHFEDQPIDNKPLDSMLESELNSLGIDFNDYVFDIKGENINLEVESTSIKCVK